MGYCSWGDVKPACNSEEEGYENHRDTSGIGEKRRSGQVSGIFEQNVSKAQNNKSHSVRYIQFPQHGRFRLLMSNFFLRARLDYVIICVKYTENIFQHCVFFYLRKKTFSVREFFFFRIYM